MTDNGEIGLWARLRQHRFYRVVTIYAIVAWVLIQLTNILSPNIDLAHRMLPALIVVLLSGFPLAVVLAWVLIKPGDPTQFNRWQRLHWKLGAALSAAAVIFVVLSGWYTWKLSERHVQRLAVAQATAKPAALASFNPPADSLVVLPFENLNGDVQQQYFSDGITQELTDALGQIPALRVIAWRTASTFRDSRLTATGIGKALNVANLLYGSILHQGDQVRVTVELVNTLTGYQVWSARYDEPFREIFTMQDRISKAVAGALQVQFADNGRLVLQATISPQAHEFYLKGRAALDQGSAASLVEAEHDFEKAIALDPQYADAYARLAHVYIKLLQVSTLPIKTAVRKSRAAASKALVLNPRNNSALVALGLLDIFENHSAQAKAEFDQALFIDPSDAAAHVDYGLILPLKQALAHDQTAVLLDPGNDAAQNNLAADYLDLELYEQALPPMLAVIRISPDQIDSAFILAFIYRTLQRNQDMVNAFDLVKPSTPLDKQLVDAGRLAYRSLLEPGLHPQALAALESLRHVKLSPYSKLDLVQLYLALGKSSPALTLLTAACPSAPVVCADLAIDPVYAPLRGNPHFEKLSREYTTVTLQ
ncbi:MAG: hypothetical protein WCC11_04550 [Gammaproteobacteria bacterium]